MDRGMNEYEMALRAAIIAVTKALLDTGNLNETVLLSRLSEKKAGLEDMGLVSGAATLGFLIRELGLPDEFWQPGSASPN
jgi:hypothetical protein